MVSRRERWCEFDVNVECMVRALSTADHYALSKAAQKTYATYFGVDESDKKSWPVGQRAQTANSNSETATPKQRAQSSTGLLTYYVGMRRKRGSDRSGIPLRLVSFGIPASYCAYRISGLRNRCGANKIILVPDRRTHGGF